MQEGLEERKAEKVDMEAAGEAPANKGKKKATKARLDKSDEEDVYKRQMRKSGPLSPCVPRHTDNRLRLPVWARR